jgi:hypothetical protein
MPSLHEFELEPRWWHIWTVQNCLLFYWMRASVYLLCTTNQQMCLSHQLEDVHAPMQVTCVQAICYGCGEYVLLTESCIDTLTYLGGDMESLFLQNQEL